MRIKLGIPASPAARAADPAPVGLTDADQFDWRFDRTGTATADHGGTGDLRDLVTAHQQRAALGAGAPQMAGASPLDPDWG